MNNKLFDRTGKVALVAGGNSGIGLGYATGIANMGGDLAIWSNDSSKDSEARIRLEAADAGRIRFYNIDVSDATNVDNGFASLLEDFGRIDCVIANAGMAPNVWSFLEFDSRKWHQLLNVNLHGAFHTLHLAATLVGERAKAGEPGGSSVFTGSLSMFLGHPGTGNYAGAKGGIGALIRAIAAKLGSYGIRTNTVAPGFTKTGIMSAADAETVARLDAHMANRTPSGRPGSPEDLEGIATYLCSDASKFHTGDAIVIDGGSLVQPAQAT